MNISRKSFVRPVAVVVLAVSVAGCSMLTSAEPAGEASSSPVAEAPAPKAVIDKTYPADDDDEDVVEPEFASQAELEIESELLSENWTLDVPRREENPDFTVRPPSPEHLFDYLPDDSVLNNASSEFNEDLRTLTSSPEHEGALATAQLTLAGAAQMVNEGNAELFAPATAATCNYCVGKLSTAYALHDGEWDLESPWAINVDTQAEVRELSGPDHLLLDIVGEETLLVTTNDNQTTVSDLAGAKMYHVEMLFDEGQWWVIGVSTEKI